MAFAKFAAISISTRLWNPDWESVFFSLDKLRENAESTSNCLTCLLLWGAVVASIGFDAYTPELLSSWVFIHCKKVLDEGPLRLMLLFAEDKNEFNKRIKLQIYRISGE